VKLLWKTAGLIFLAAAMSLPAGCAVSMRKTLPGMAVPPETVISKLKRLSGDLQTNKQIFRVRLFDKGRTSTAAHWMRWCTLSIITTVKSAAR